MSLLSIPYQRIHTDKVEKYQEKLKQRKHNQDWIFANYFGNPGGGAPIKDKNGQVITKIKTIADNHIYLFPSEEFTKVEPEMKKDKSDQRIIKQPNDNYMPLPLPHQLNYPIEPNYQLQQQSDYQPNPFQYPYQHIPNHHQDQFSMINNPRPQPYYLPFDPQLVPFSYYPYPYSLYPPPYPINTIQPPAQSAGTSNINPQSSAVNQSIPNQVHHLLEPSKTKEDTIDLRNNNQMITYALPQDNKDKSRKDVQKELWKKELLIQMQEKKEREKYEKKRQEETEKQDELKYQEYLLIKKEQAEQQEQKRRHKIQKKLITQGNESNDLGLLNINNNYDSIPNRSTSPIRNINNQPLESSSSYQNNNYNLAMQTQSEEDYQQYNNFKSLVDSQYIALNQSLKEDFDKEMKKITEDYQLKYQDEKIEALAQIRDQPSQLTNQVIHSERKMKHLQDMIEQRRLVDYILDKNRNASTFTTNANAEMDENVFSYFGQNNDRQTKYYNLQSASSFVYGNKIPFEDHKAMTLANVNKVDQQNSVCFERSLDNISTFQPFVKETKKKLQLIPSQKEVANEEENAFVEMFEKLDNIAELSKQIDKTVKYQTIKGNFEIDMQHNPKAK